MSHFTTEHFSGTVRTTKDSLRFGPLEMVRVSSVPSDTEGRNGDLIIVDDTADSSERVAVERVPVSAQLCQKVPILVSPGTFTISTASGIFTITISSLDDVVPEVKKANIPGLSVEIDGRGTIVFNTVSATFADGTSDFPSATGVSGLQAGTVEVPTGTWACFPVGSFGSAAYGKITGDTGSSTATASSETITFTGTGISVVGTNAGLNADSVSWNLNISDLPIGAGPLVSADELAVDDGGTTERHSIEDIVDAALPGTRVTLINGQPMLTLVDTTRGNKILSVSEQAITYGSNLVNHLTWISIHDATDANSGYIADFDGTVVYANAHCADTGANSKDIHLFINGIDNGIIGTLSGGVNVTFTNTTLNIDFIQGDRIRLQARDIATGSIEDTVAKLTIKWRG